MARPESIFFPGLNGIRAIAALGVIACHTVQAQPRLGLAQYEVVQLGDGGVTIFFTLSGFLITYLLLQERERTGHVKLSHFYLRRILRIWPLYFAYLILAFITVGIGNRAEDVLLLVFFLPNIVFNLGQASPETAHLWSIGIEEQFYAFWPIVVSKVRRLVPFLLMFVIAMIVARVGLKVLSVRSHNKLPFSIISSARYDCMAIGALFAIGYHRRNEVIMRIGRTIVVQLAFWVVVVLLAVSKFHMFSLFGEDVISVVTGFFILSQIQSQREITLLENPVLSLLGQISFGIYIYHPLVISGLVALHNRGFLTVPNLPTSICVVAGATITVAFVSFRVLEKPFLRLKHRFTSIESRNR